MRRLADDRVCHAYAETRRKIASFVISSSPDRPRNSDRRQRGIGSSGGAKRSIGRRRLLLCGVIVLDTKVAAAMMGPGGGTEKRPLPCRLAPCPHRSERRAHISVA